MLIRGYDILTFTALHSVILRIAILKSNKIDQSDRESDCAIASKVANKGILFL